MRSILTLGGPSRRSFSPGLVSSNHQAGVELQLAGPGVDAVLDVADADGLVLEAKPGAEPKEPEKLMALIFRGARGSRLQSGLSMTIPERRAAYRPRVLQDLRGQGLCFFLFMAGRGLMDCGHVGSSWLYDCMAYDFQSQK